MTRSPSVIDSLAKSIRIPAHVSGLTSVCVGLGAWGVFLLVEMLSEKLWEILMCLSIMALFLGIYAALRTSKWWFVSAVIALLLIVGLIGAIAG